MGTSDALGGNGSPASVEQVGAVGRLYTPSGACPFPLDIFIQETLIEEAAIKWTPQEAFNQTQSGSFLRDPSEGKNSTSSTRTLRLPDATSAAWYILTIVGIYGLIFVFRLASNILRKNERSLEDVYYSNLTSELKRKGLQGKAGQGLSPISSNADAHSPQQIGLEPKCEDSRFMGTQVVP
ncbi:small integral membrane protein 34 [Apodemus sylvaticus]|uniref:small integral membrane protein 34 n=1 Tax=Apodemus sylvaticus TaxID=10129 RepID=UPI002244116F|nr:small integral membrane protein 34 [Apodemus sylvaticus]